MKTGDDAFASKDECQKRGKDKPYSSSNSCSIFSRSPKDTFSTTLKALEFIALSEGVAQINEYGSPIHCH